VKSGYGEPIAIVLSYFVPQAVYGDPGVHRAHSDAANPAHQQRSSRISEPAWTYKVSFPLVRRP
jgi:hypothetical protein